MANKTEVIGLSDTHGLIGNPITVFNSLGPDVQGWILFFTGLMALAFLVVTVLALFGHGIGASTSSLQRNSSGHQHHMVGIVSAIVTVILIIVAVGMVFAIYC
jgi:uncharacterized membrane protein